MICHWCVWISEIAEIICMFGFIRWFKNSKLLENQKKYQIDSDPQTGVLTLIIKKAGKVDLGIYECEVQTHVSHCYILRVWVWLLLQLNCWMCDPFILMLCVCSPALYLPKLWNKIGSAKCKAELCRPPATPTEPVPEKAPPVSAKGRRGA